MLLKIAWIERENSEVLFDITKVAQHAARLQRNVFPVYVAALPKL
jgi:hypothetical protein